jgi:hypothetical protein
MRDTIAEIAQKARPGARVASESPLLASYYAQRFNRSDLSCVSLSDAAAMTQLSSGDFVIVARGRRYFSNDKLISSLATNATPDFQLFLGPTPSVKVYVLNDTTAGIVHSASQVRSHSTLMSTSKG